MQQSELTKVKVHNEIEVCETADMEVKSRIEKVLLENKSNFLVSVDKAICFYHEHLKKRQEKELRYASLIIQKGVYSYFDLLKLNPFWFKILYDELKTKTEKK